VRTSEIPWLAALRSAFMDGDETENARALLAYLCRTLVINFPGQGVPNKLQQEFRELMFQGGVPRNILLLEHLAADIFRGFGPKFGRGALSAVRFARSRGLELYEKFWGLTGIYDKIEVSTEICRFAFKLGD
jgi:hypothetical protein